MKLSRQTALVLLAVLLALLLFGTQMPSAWRDEAFRVTQLPWQLTKVTHFVLLAALAAVARLPRWGCFAFIGVRPSWHYLKRQG